MRVRAPDTTFAAHLLRRRPSLPPLPPLLGKLPLPEGITRNQRGGGLASLPLQQGCDRGLALGQGGGGCCGLVLGLLLQEGDLGGGVLLLSLRGGGDRAGCCSECEGSAPRMPPSQRTTQQSLRGAVTKRGAVRNVKGQHCACRPVWQAGSTPNKSLWGKETEQDEGEPRGAC